jgi:hypothetical protein
MNKYLNIIKNIIKNQDTNYIFAVIVSILSALILHGYIKVPYILTTKIFNLIYLIIISCVGKYNLYLSIIFSILFLIINSVNQVETFTDEDDDDDEEEEEQEESEETEESEEKKSNSKKISVKIKKKKNTNCRSVCDDDKICLKNCYRQIDTSSQVDKSTDDEDEKASREESDESDGKDGNDFEDQISAFEIAKENLISNIKKNKK